MYEKQEWIGGKTGTPATPERMNHLENGVYENSQAINGEKSMGSIAVEDIVSKNMLDLNQTFRNYYVSNTGALSYDGHNYLSDYISVKPNLNYTTSVNTGIYAIVIAEFDENQNFIKRTPSSDGDTSITITTDSNTKYIRIWFNLDNSTIMTHAILTGLEPQLELGNEASPYTSHKKYGHSETESMGKIVVDDITCKNILNSMLFVDNKFLYYSSGVENDSENTKYWRTGIQKIQPNTTYYCNKNMNSIVFYDMYRNPIRGINDVSMVTSASNEYYIQTSFAKSSIGITGEVTISKKQDEAYIKNIDDSNLEHYSTTEQVIGTWIDGKPLYRKVITKSTFPANTTTSVAHNISNLDMVSKFDGVLVIDYDSTTFKRKVPLHWLKTDFNISLAITDTYLNFISTHSTEVTVTAYVILEYTKTTDTSTSSVSTTSEES